MDILMIDRLNIAYSLIIIISLFFFNQAFSQIHFVSKNCVDDTLIYTASSPYKLNLKFLLANITNQASIAHFNNYTVGDKGIDTAYGLYLCRPDLKEKQCHDCVMAASTKIIESCPFQKEAVLWYEECMVRYANRTIFSRDEESPVGILYTTVNFTNVDQISEILANEFTSLIVEAAHNTSARGFATRVKNITEFQQLYSAAHCTPDILGAQCERCLRKALASMAGCCGTSSLQISMHFPSCSLRYDTAPFIGLPDSTPALSTTPIPVQNPPTPTPGKSSTTTLTSFGINLVLCLMLALSIPPLMMSL